MDVFEHFAVATQTATGDWGYYPLVDCVVRHGFTGTFFRLTCAQDTGEDLVATCDNRYREHLRPYLDLLLKSQDGTSTEQPVVPLFLGNDSRWRFSWLGAEHDYPELRGRSSTTETASPRVQHGATRLQVNVSHDLATRFRMAALERGLSHTDLLLELIRDTVT